MHLKPPTLSPEFSDTLIKMAIIDEMARADNWGGINECLNIKPEVIKTLARYADAALRAVRRMRKTEIEITDLN